MCVEKWEREKQNGSCAIERGKMEEVKAMRSRLIWMASLLPGAMVNLQA